MHHFATSVLPFDSRADNMKCRLFDAVDQFPSIKMFGCQSGKWQACASSSRHTMWEQSASS